jgi:hypothetical protein
MITANALVTGFIRDLPLRSQNFYKSQSQPVLKIELRSQSQPTQPKISSVLTKAGLLLRA